MTKRILLLSIAFVLSLTLTHLQAQVTVGDGTPPHSFSMLEIISNKTGGLRLPHLTTAERNTLTATADFQAESHRVDGGTSTPPGLGLGLTIYNTDTNCTEYWNGYKWVSLCLGTADIVLNSPCGIYDASNPPQEDATGIHSGCVYTPEEKPVCTVSSGKPFEVHLLIGASYATLEIDQVTSAFTVQFQSNNSNMTRNAVVRVTSNCTGEHKDFIFIQKGGTCSGAANPVVSTNSNALCAGGSVIAYVTNAQAGVNYIWTFSGTAVHTGSWYTIIRPGTHKVYAGLIGCGTPATITINDNSGSVAPRAVHISATNGGVICGGANVVLTANTSQTVYWYHKGVLHTSNNNPLAVSGAASAGEWFAVVKDAGGCMSQASNVLTLLDNTTAGTALPAPVATVNGDQLTGNNLTICKSGTLRLEVINHTSYPAGVEYEWFIDGATISKGSSPVYMYNTPEHLGNLTISVIVSDRSGNCPNSAISSNTNVTLSSPAPTSINNGELTAPICTGTTVPLIADITTGTAYEWYLDGVLIPAETGSSMNASIPGKYTVRYTDGTGCWTLMSTEIEVVQSSILSMAWNAAPTGKAIKGQSVAYTINASPAAPAYKWSYTLDDPQRPDPIANIAPIGDGSTAMVVYGTPVDDDIKVTLKAESMGHPCGDQSITQEIVVEDGCVRGTTISMVPKGVAEVKEGQSVNFGVSTDASEVQRKFLWYIDGVKVDETTTDTWTRQFNTAGRYQIEVQVINKCTALTDNVKTGGTTVNVNADVNQYPDDGSGDYWINGKECYDVAITLSDFCGDRTTRNFGDFMDNTGTWTGGGKEFEYEFKFSGSFDNLQFMVEDPSKVVKNSREDIGVLYKKVFIEFDESVLAKAQGRTRDNALVVTVYATYTVGGSKRKVGCKIKIQDCECGCGLIGTSSGKWRRVACHNLGGNTAADPLDPASALGSKGALNGDYYQFGRKDIAAKYDDPESMVVGWANGYPATVWSDGAKGPADPCPTGFRLPTRLEVEEFVKHNPKFIAKGNWTNGASNYSSGIMWGTATGQYLFMPTTGMRYYTNGQLIHRGTVGYYWTSTPNPQSYMRQGYYYVAQTTGNLPLMTININMLYDNRTGMAVRCVSEQ